MSALLESLHDTHIIITAMSFLGNCESAESALRASLPASDWEAIEAFRQFLRIRTVSAEGPVTGAYRAAVDYLHARFSAAGVQCEIKEYVAGKPILLATVPGTEPSLPSVLLNSHYDVVPVMPEKWTYEPFSGVVNEHQEIVGRGAQDMKVVCIQYVESLLALLRAGRRFRRTIHLSFVPDEEVSGRDGMCKWLSDGDAFQSLNVGLALDEGIASETDKFTVFYGERAIWWLKVRATGVTGHASRLPTHTAMQSLIESIQHFLDFRQTQVDKLHGGCAHAQAIKLGDVVSLNLTMLKGGVTADNGQTYSLNVIPTECEAGFDLRIPPTIDLKEFEEQCIKKWTNIDGVSYEFIQATQQHHVTSTDPKVNPWFGVFSAALADANYSIEPEIFPAATDSRFIRKAGVAALGFSPMRHERVLLHDHDERVKASTFVEGLRVYEHLIPRLADADPALFAQ